MAHAEEFAPIRRPFLAAALIAAAVAVARSASFVFWPNAAFDSDQAIVGLMAKHVAEGPAPGEWSVDCSVPDAGGADVSFISGADTTATIGITFDANGAMVIPTADVTILVPASNGGAPLRLTWDLYDDAATPRSHGDVTGYASDSGTTFQYQDGYPAGTLRSISVDDQGVVTATYSNGEMTPMFQVALADFPSYDGLSKMGNNLYAESMASGQALPSTAGTGRLGNISPASLEMSNVDLAEEFVKMITTQRAFQANSRVITSSDEILQELINIKR